MLGKKMKENKVRTFDQQDYDGNLLEKVEKIMLDYNHATGSCIGIYDKAYKPMFLHCKNCSPEKEICPYCVKFKPVTGRELEAFPCHEMHVNAIKEANKKGGSYIYECSLGLLFWTSPIYTEGSFSGAVRGCGFLTEGQKAVDFFSNANNTFVMCNNEIPKEEFKERVSSFPGADGKKSSLWQK